MCDFCNLFGVYGGVIWGYGPKSLDHTNLSKGSGCWAKRWTTHPSPSGIGTHQSICKYLGVEGGTDPITICHGNMGIAQVIQICPNNCHMFISAKCEPCIVLCETFRKVHGCGTFIKSRCFFYCHTLLFPATEIRRLTEKKNGASVRGERAA